MIVATSDAVLIALIGFPTAMIGAVATFYGTRVGRKRDIATEVNQRISTAFAQSDAVIARLEAERAKLELKIEREEGRTEKLSNRIDDLERKERECLKREEALSLKYEDLEGRFLRMEAQQRRRREEDSSPQS